LAAARRGDLTVQTEIPQEGDPPRDLAEPVIETVALSV
jgi:hypothetical protein